MDNVSKDPVARSGAAEKRRFDGGWHGDHHVLPAEVRNFLSRNCRICTWVGGPMLGLLLAWVADRVL